MSRSLHAKDLCCGMTTLDGWAIVETRSGLMYPEGQDHAEYMVLVTLEREVGDPDGYTSSRGEYERTITDTRRTCYDGDEIVELGE